MLRPAAPWFLFALVAVEERKGKSKENEKEKLVVRQRHFIAAQFLKLLHTREFMKDEEGGNERRGERERGIESVCAFFNLLKHLQLLL